MKLIVSIKNLLFYVWIFYCTITIRITIRDKYYTIA
jgi:hypothetical protein